MPKRLESQGKTDTCKTIYKLSLSGKPSSLSSNCVLPGNINRKSIYRIVTLNLIAKTEVVRIKECKILGNPNFFLKAI